MTFEHLAAHCYVIWNQNLIFSPGVLTHLSRNIDNLIVLNTTVCLRYGKIEQDRRNPSVVRIIQNNHNKT